jgi:hypothetical protein
MSIVHRKLKPVDQNLGDLALHVYRTPETETSKQNVGDQALHVYRTPETETNRSDCRRQGTSCLLYTGN